MTETLGSDGPKAHLVVRPPTLPPWPPPRWIWGWPHPLGGNPRWGHSPSPSPIYSGGFGAAIHMRLSFSWRSPTALPPPLPRCLAKPCRIATLLHHHHAVMLLLDGVIANLSLSPCWIKASETSPGCTCVERGGTVVRCLDRIWSRSESLRERLHRPRSCNASASRPSRV